MMTSNLQADSTTCYHKDRFEQIYQQYHKAVYGNIFRLVHDEALAQDLFQETFLALWHHLVQQPEKHDVASWLFVVSHNKATACLKAKLKESLVFVTDYKAFENADAPAHDEALLEAQLELITHAVDHLSPRRKRAFILHKFEGKSIEEIAVAMNATQGTVREYLKQSVRTVRQQVIKEKAVVEGAVLLVWMMAG